MKITLNNKMLLAAALLVFGPYYGYSQNTSSNPGSKTEMIYKKDIFGDTVVEDERGNVVATFKKDFQGRTVEQRVKTENRPATIKKDFSDNFVEEDDKGRKRIYKKNSLGDTVVEDEMGRSVSTIKKDFWGNYVEEDKQGNKKVYKKNSSGDTTVEDDRGNVLGTYKKNIFGAVVFEPK